MTISLDRGTIGTTSKMADVVRQGQQGIIRVASFQRRLKWTPEQTCGLLESIWQRHPTGSLFLHEIGPTEQGKEDHSRWLEGIKPKKDSHEQKWNLIDGQQRLTGLCHAMLNRNSDVRFFIKVDLEALSAQLTSSAEDEGDNDEDDENGNEDGIVIEYAEFQAINRRLKLTDNPRTQLKRGLIPLDIAWLSAARSARRNWTAEATTGRSKITNLNQIVGWTLDTIRERLGSYGVVMHQMTGAMTIDEVIQVYIRINSAGTALTREEIMLARAEKASQSDARSSAKAVLKEAPLLTMMFPDKGNVDTEAEACAMMVRAHWHARTTGPSTEQKAFEDTELLAEVFPARKEMLNGFRWASELAERAGAVSHSTLPTGTAIEVLATLHPLLPDDAEELQRVETVLREYIWCTWCDLRYQRKHAKRQRSDRRELEQWLKNERNVSDLSFSKDHQAPEAETLRAITAGQMQNRLRKALSAIATSKGALDIATGRRMTKDEAGDRELHHVFPKALLEKHNIPRTDADMALNTIWIEPKSNGRWGDKDPQHYLREAEDQRELTVSVRECIESHVIDYESLVDNAGAPVAQRYETFINSRAKEIAKALRTAVGAHDLFSGSE